MKLIGTCNGLPKSYALSDLRVDHAGYFKALSFRVGGSDARQEMIVRPGRDASLVLPVDFARREVYLLRAPRLNRFFAATGEGRQAINALVDGKLDLSGRTFVAEGEDLHAFDTVAGMIDAGETPEEAGLREMEEEAGIKGELANLKSVALVYGSIGMASERKYLYLYEVTEVVERVEPKGDGTEQIEVWRLSFEEAFALLDQGQLPNAGGHILVERLKRIDLERQLASR